MTTRRKLSGFSIVEALIAIVAVAALAGLGFAVYQHTKQSATTTGAAPNANQPTQTQPGPTVAYLHVKEWKVKLPLSDNIKDAYYVVSTTSSRSADGLPGTIWLGLKSLTSPNCNPENNNHGERGAIGAILRIPPPEKDPITGQLLTQEYPNGITIGSYYYAYQTQLAHNACATANDLKPADASFSSAASQQTNDLN